MKIGTSRQIQSRLCDLNCASPYPVRVEYMADTNGDIDVLEAYVHTILADRRMNGEWFLISISEAKETIQTAAREMGFNLTTLDVAPLLRNRKTRHKIPSRKILDAMQKALESRGVSFTPHGVARAP